MGYYIFLKSVAVKWKWKQVQVKSVIQIKYLLDQICSIIQTINIMWEDFHSPSFLGIGDLKFGTAGLVARF
jgi:hypothetical protein